jgi:predicted DNA-binding protein (UPF0251 family)
MARPEICRKICKPPKMEGFKPYGMSRYNTAPVVLKVEEFESIRLIDYEQFSQDLAAKQMNISRPTFTRIYNRALKTIAKAFVEGKRIEIEGGNFQFEHDWLKCKKCHRLIKGIENHNKCKGCKSFNSNELIRINQSNILQNL